MASMIAAGITLALGTVALLALGILYGAFVVWVLWGWFMVPLGLPQITIAWAVGIALMGAVLQATPPPANEDDRRMHAITGLLKPVFALAIGWVAKQFM
jgi:hypothetical protein